MDNEQMCFIVIYHNNNLVQQCMQIDDGESAYQLANEKGYSIRKWEMYGMKHFHELPDDTKKDIKEFIKGLK
ncbi:hypothetical protein QTL86_13640 [Cellulosilyticum sp. ST5]|uniref:hypothetical protein n=1 Tax=Cellulosilyticum sp. ST5 TaxID=3055805 RepID=UPI0039778482